MSDSGTYPIIAIISFAGVMVCWRLVHSLGSADVHFGKEERVSLDYIENKRTSSPKDWAHGLFLQILLK
jgi:hypothetical protein